MDHPTPTGRMGNEVAIFFEGALLPSTGAGRARVSFRTAHLVKRRATPADQGFSQACRGKAKSLASTSQGCHSTKTRKPHTKGSRDTSFPTREQPQASRTGTGYGGGARGNRNPSWGASPTLPSKLAEDLKRSLDTSTVSGAKVEFRSMPIQQSKPREIGTDAQQLQAITENWQGNAP